MIGTIVARRAGVEDFDALLQMYLDAGGGKIGGKRDLLENGIRKLLANADLGFQIVAEAQGRIVGMLRVCHEWSPYRDGTIWWIENVYVAPVWRRRGVYTAMDALVRGEAARDPGVCGVRLYTEEDNHGARLTYRRAGMRGRMVAFFEVDYVYGPPSELRDGP